jgi:hypothetical protein
MGPVGPTVPPPPPPEVIFTPFTERLLNIPVDPFTTSAEIVLIPDSVLIFKSSIPFISIPYNEKRN